MYHPSIIERAFEVAKTSTTIDEIRHEDDPDTIFRMD